MKPSRLPRHEIQGTDWGAHAAETLAFLSRFGLYVLIGLIALAAAGWLILPRVHAHGIAEGQSATRADVRAELEEEMRRACPCWFNDARCNKPRATVVCRAPEWMKR